jgi:hypothetical protein
LTMQVQYFSLTEALAFMPALSAMHLLIHLTSSVVTANAALLASKAPAARQNAVVPFMTAPPDMNLYSGIFQHRGSGRKYGERRR